MPRPLLLPPPSPWCSSPSPLPHYFGRFPLQVLRPQAVAAQLSPEQIAFLERKRSSSGGPAPSAAAVSHLPAAGWHKCA